MSGRRVVSTIAVRLLLAGVILGLEFAALEAALRYRSGSEAAPGFQALFMQVGQAGYRPRPGAHTRYVTDQFTTDLRINAQGVRDDEDLGPKAPDERRVLVLGDSLVMAVQVPLEDTFGKRLERRLNAWDPSHRWRVINGGVQGYGSVEEWLFYRDVAAAFDPDIVLVVVTVANDAVEANDAEARLHETAAVRAPATSEGGKGVRRLIRSSIVFQMLRVRWDQLRARFSAPVIERPLSTYLDHPPAYVTHGLDVARECLESIATLAASRGARVGFVLMPARFQTDDADFERLSESTAQAGGRLVRNAATERFQAALAPLRLPMLDLLPVLAARPDRVNLFFQENVHLTRLGHTVVGDALFDFVTAAPLRTASP